MKGPANTCSKRRRGPAALRFPPAALLALLALPAGAYPEFQRDLVQRTGRPVDCAYCHRHADGPEGTAPGQIGRLTAAELEQLGQARAALEPGQTVASPILNEFGNHLVRALGKRRIAELKLAPDRLSEALPPGSDLDADGVSDAGEYRDGTHPLLDSDGNPLRLFRHNFRRNFGQIAVTFVATLCGLYGLYHLLVGVAVATRRPGNENEEESHG